MPWRGPRINLAGATCYCTRPSLFPTAACSIRPCPGRQWPKSTCQQAPAEGQPPVWWPPLLGRVGCVRRNPFSDPWETAVWGQILARSLLEANVWPLAAPRPAIKLPFWDPWETAVLGQILARSLLEANFLHLAAPRPAIKLPFWDPWEMAVLGQILVRSLLEQSSGI